MEKNMLYKFKALISILGIIALILTTFSAISFADRGEREYRGDRNSGRHDSRFDNRDSRSRGDRSDRDRGDREDDGDDDDVAAPTPPPVETAPEPGPTENPLCSTCHQYPGTNTTPSGHPNVGGTPTAPAVDPTPVPTTPVVVEPTPVPTTPVVVEPTPPATDPVVVEPTPPATAPGYDPQTEYNNNCAICHGSANAGRNVPSSHLGDSRAQNLSQGQIDAINAL
jgi:hypothetical protein